MRCVRMVAGLEVNFQGFGGSHLELSVPDHGLLARADQAFEVGLVGVAFKGG